MTVTIPDVSVVAPPGLPGEPMRLRAQLLGTFRIELDGRRITSWGSGRSRAVLQYLLLTGRPVARERLMDVFWPHLPPDRARNNLNVAVSGLRRVLGDDARRIVEHRHGCYALGADVSVWVDTEVFETHLRRAHAFDARGQRAEAIAEYQAAVDVGDGDLLSDDPYADWLVDERAFLRRAQRDAVERLAQLLLEDDRPGTAGWACQLGLRHDHLDEGLVGLWLTSLARGGRSRQALAVLEDFRSRVHEELGARPSDQFERLVAAAVMAAPQS